MKITNRRLRRIIREAMFHSSTTTSMSIIDDAGNEIDVNIPYNLIDRPARRGASSQEIEKSILAWVTNEIPSAVSLTNDSLGFIDYSIDIVRT